MTTTSAFAAPRTDTRLHGPWMWLSAAAALMAAGEALVAILAPDRIYGRETEILTDLATAQDLVQLVAVCPLIVILGLRAASSMAAHLTWLGCLAFTAYNNAIYAFSIHFGPLFLPWVAVLGLSTYAFAGALSTLDTRAVKSRSGGRSQRLTGWSLVLLGVLFAALWLSQIGSDLLAGDVSRSAAEWKVPTNPVHVLDLALFLPAVVSAGVLLLRRHRLGYAAAPGALVFLALTCLPILATPAVASSRDHVTSWGVVLPIGVVLAITLVALDRTLTSLRTRSAD